MDSLNTHFKKSFYESFYREECERLLKKIKSAYTSKHVSWINKAEIEINLPDYECLDRNIGNEDELKRQMLLCCKENISEKRIFNWSFT